MSLKAIHIVFIIASSLVAIIFGVWAFGEFFGSDGEPVHLIYAAIAIAMLVALLFFPPDAKRLLETLPSNDRLLAGILAGGHGDQVPAGLQGLRYPFIAVGGDGDIAPVPRPGGSEKKFELTDRAGVRGQMARGNRARRFPRPGCGRTRRR